MYASNIGAPKYIKQILTDLIREIENNTIIVGDFNITLTSIDRPSRQKITKTTVILDDKIDQLDLIDISRTFHPKITDYTFFSIAHGTFSRIDHMLGHKTSLNEFKKIKIISSIFSNYNSMKLEITYRKKNGRSTNMWRLNNIGGFFK